MPVIDSSTSIGMFSRIVSQSRFRYGQANGRISRNAPPQRSVASAIGGTWPAT